MALRADSRRVRRSRRCRPVLPAATSARRCWCPPMVGSYAGNRLHDSIGIFAIGRDGTLTFVADEWTRGNYPRSFAVDPTGSFLYCCNQRADNVTVFRVDRSTGGLAFTGQYVPVGNPSHVVFLDLK